MPKLHLSIYPPKGSCHPHLSHLSQLAHKHHKVILHAAFGLLLIDLGQHMFPVLHWACAHCGLESSGQVGAVLATATEYLRGVEPPKV